MAAIHDDSPVMFQLKEQDNHWLSCFVAGSDCQFRSCPSSFSNPFQWKGDTYE